MNTRAHIVIRGVVQGVFFRSSAKRYADSLGVKGWIRNLSSGAVEGIFEGEESAVKKLIEYSRKGPTRAVVDNVSVSFEAYQGEFEDFKIKYRN